ncbi:MAG: hypothetical protein HYY40_02905 [Bacteroidetes bacterium]|nr:hypothetical protein [Bacteroidota bacterium]
MFFSLLCLVNIAIVTYTFYPEINARALRVTELAREFCRRNHRVIVFIPDINQYLGDIENTHGLEIVKVSPGFFLNRKERILAKSHHITGDSSNNSALPPETGKPSFSKIVKKKIVEFFYMGAFPFEFSFTCARELGKPGYRFDLLISSALPICAHLAGGMAKIRNKNLAKVMVADYGDPYSGNDNINPPFFHKWVEKYLVNRYDYASVPRINSYYCKIPFKRQERILEIPQGIKISDYKRAGYVPGKNPVFACAGTFYERIRNPSAFLDYLCSSFHLPFKFFMYTDFNNRDSFDLLSPYISKLEERLTVSPLIPRQELIYELSKADFLINIANKNDGPLPSKLIDYKICGRPVYSFKQEEFSPEIFNEFITGNYRNDFCRVMDIEKYKIENVAQKFLDLARQ